MVDLVDAEGRPETIVATPRDSSPPSSSSSSSSSTPPLVETDEGYYRWAGITFSWAKACTNEYERRAITSLVHKNELKNPDHPLADATTKEVPFYIGEFADGNRQLCYSLGQVQYLQHYIYEMGLTDPNHPNNCANPATSRKDDKKPIRRVPLPAGFIPAESFKSVTPVAAGQDPRKVDVKLRKENKRRGNGFGHAPMLPAVTPSTPPLDASAAPSASNPESSPDLGYFELAQQAVALALVGGLKTEQERLQERDPNVLEDDPATGRALFIAVYTREQPNIDNEPELKDVGYDAMLFLEDPDEPGNFIAVSDREHWLVEEEIAFGGGPTPYLFAMEDQLTRSSLLKPRSSIKGEFQKKLVDLWIRSGRGPVYFVIHSTDYDAAGFDHLGINIGGVKTELTGSANAHSNGQKFWIDTARLFGEVENGLPGSTAGADCLTRRSLKEIMTILFGTPNDPAYTASDNAGNDAAYTMIIFHKLLLSEPPRSLSEVRAWLAPRIASAPALEDSSSKTSSVPLSAHTPADHAPVKAANGSPAVDQTLIANIVQALARCSVDDEPDLSTSMVDTPIDQCDSDWEDEVEFMVTNSDGELVPFTSSDSE